jgi:hypothetical protein
MNYVNQDYMRVNLTGSQSKKCLFLPGYGPIPIADWSIIVHSSIGQTWVLAPIGAVFEMGDLIGHRKDCLYYGVGVDGWSLVLHAA